MPSGGGSLERRAVQREQGAEHLDIVRGRVQQGGRGGGNPIGQGVDVKVHRVEHGMGGVPAGILRGAKRAVAAGKLRSALLECVKGVQICADERVPVQAAQHRKRAQTQGKGGKIHGFHSLGVFLFCLSIPHFAGDFNIG